MSLTALYTIDRFGRRKTLLTGLAVMTTIWILIGVLLKFYPATNSSAPVPHGLIIFLIWCFYRWVNSPHPSPRSSSTLTLQQSTYVMSWGPCGWWVPMEILPTNLRARGAALSTSFTFLCNLCVSKTTPLLFVRIGYKTYFFYAGLCALSTLVTLVFLPETKGLTLEELDTLFERAPYIVWLGRYRVDNRDLMERPLSGVMVGETEIKGEKGTCMEEIPDKSS